MAYSPAIPVLMNFEKEIHECRSIISSGMGGINSELSPLEIRIYQYIETETKQCASVCDIILKYILEVIRSHQIDLINNQDVIRNTFLLAAMTDNKVLFDSVRHRKRDLISLYQVTYNNPEMTFFTNFETHIPQSNKFLQILHNLLCYQGFASWLDRFMIDEASSRSGTYYLAAGKGSINEIELNIKKWYYGLNIKNMIQFVHSQTCRPEVIALLEGKIP